MDFEKIYYKYYSEIYRFAFRLSMSKTDSQDLLQDAFTKLFKMTKNGAKLTNPKSWLYKVVLNQWRNTYNQAKLRRDKLNQMDMYNDNRQTPESDYIKNEKLKLTLDCLSEIQMKDKDILLLYHDGFSYSEIADILEIKETSVGKTLSRALQNFKQILKTTQHELFE